MESSRRRDAFANTRDERATRNSVARSVNAQSGEMRGTESWVQSDCGDSPFASGGAREASGLSAHSLYAGDLELLKPGPLALASRGDDDALCQSLLIQRRRIVQRERKSFMWRKRALIHSTWGGGI